MRACGHRSGNDDYAHELYTAMTDLWDGTGMFVFTSSGSVFAEKDGGVVNEESPLAESVKSSPLGSETNAWHVLSSAPSQASTIVLTVILGISVGLLVPIV